MLFIMERPKSLKATTKKLVEQAEMVCLANATSFMQMLILIYQGIKKFNNSDFLNYNIQIIKNKCFLKCNDF